MRKVGVLWRAVAGFLLIACVLAGPIDRGTYAQAARSSPHLLAGNTDPPIPGAPLPSPTV